MAKFLRVGAGMVNLDYVVAVENAGGALCLKLSTGTAVRVEGAEASYVSNHLKQHAACASPEERQTWSHAALTVANELVGTEPTPEQRRELATRLLRLVDQITSRGTLFDRRTR